jgi:very-short-patch-repair endonuclease
MPCDSAGHQDGEGGMKRPKYDDDYDRQEAEYYSSPYERKLAEYGDDYSIPNYGKGFQSLGETVIGAIDGIGLAYELGAVCESPIEVIFGAHLKRLTLPEGFVLQPQFKWRRWRMDFAILRDGEPVIFIECDGRAFHSTPEQIANDAAKDSAARSARIKLIRLTGSEIHRRPVDCAEYVLQQVAK